jgi:hypothetical protein
MPMLAARGDKADLVQALPVLEGGEIVFAEDEGRLYVVEGQRPGGTLRAVAAGSGTPTAVAGPALPGVMVVAATQAAAVARRTPVVGELWLDSSGLAAAGSGQLEVKAFDGSTWQVVVPNGLLSALPLLDATTLLDTDVIEIELPVAAGGNARIKHDVTIADLKDYIVTPP